MPCVSDASGYNSGFITIYVRVRYVLEVNSFSGLGSSQAFRESSWGLALRVGLRSLLLHVYIGVRCALETGLKYK